VHLGIVLLDTFKGFAWHSVKDFTLTAAYFWLPNEVLLIEDVLALF
jgi:hypothetical protein